MRSIILSSRGSTMAEDRKSVASGHSSNASVPTLTDPTGKPITPLRKFTAGVIKPGEAKQQRDAVLKVMSSQNPWRVPPISSPLDYEKFITERNVQLENDPHRDLLLFPRDDVEEILMKPEQSTEVPVQVQEDLSRAWLLTKEAINFYSQPYHTVCFNYMKFSGDYNKLNQGSTLDGQTPLASLVFESDLAQEEAKANDEGICLPDIIKEGYVNINKNDATLLPNPKSGKKRYCSVRRQESGDVVLEVRKAPQDEPKLVKINSAQLRQTKKGRPILEIGTIAEETGDKVEPAKPLTVYSDDTEEIKSWLQAILRAIALSPKMDSISVCSEKLEKLGVGGRAEPQQDTVSTHSDDSSGSKDLTSWRGRNNTARVLQPPTVERHNMFSLYYRLQPLLVDSRGCVQESGDRRTRWSSSPDPYSSMRHMNMTMHTVVPEHAHFFAVKYKELAVKLPIAHGKTEQIEPFFISMFLFDSKSGRRLSEEFHVQSTGAKSRDVTPGASDPLATCLALSTNPKLAEALFSVAQARDNLWLVCRIDRGLHADTTADVYMKSNPDPKIVQKLHKSIQSSALRLSSYRQRFAWAARPLHLDSCPSVDTVSLPLYRCENNRLTEQDLQKFLSDFVKTEKSKLVIPNTSVTVSIDSTASPADYSCRISSSLLPMKPWNFDSKEPVVPVFEVQPFGDIILEPHTELINLLYVYPLSLKYDSQKLYSKARNITCTVRFVRGDDKTNQAVFDRLAPGGPFTSSACCAVQHHQQVPTFGDEVKMKLPLALTASDHILFSFTHVSISGQSTAKSPESLETPIGYAWCPLVRKNRLELDSDEQEISLPVADQLPSAFTRSRAHSQGKDDHDIRWVENKPIFRVRLRLLSSAFTTESRLQAFFQSCQKLESRGCGGDAADQVKMTNSLMRRRHSRDESLQEEPARSCSPLARYATFHADNPIVHEVTKWTESLVGVPIDKLLPFLPVVLSRLFSIFPHAPSDVLALATMRTIISICDRCLRIGRKNLLKTFVKLHFVVGEEHAEETVLSSICRYLPAVIRGAKINKDKDELKTIFAQLWFFLEIAGKSLAQNIIHNRLFRKIPKDRLAPDVLETVGLMVEAVIKTVIENHKELPEECRQANVAISTFVKKSLTFLDRGAVFNWIYQAVIAYDSNEPKMLREYKNTLLLIVCEHEHWLPLNLPVLMDLNNQIRRVEYQPPPITTVSSTGTGFMSRILGQTGGYNWLSQLFQPAAVEQYDSDRYAQCADEWCLSAGYASRHFLAGLLFQELKASLRESREFRRQSFGILRNLLAKHSFDTRYSDVSKQQRIATLYAPLLRFAVEIIGELEFVVQDTKEGPALRILSKPFETRESPTKTLAPGLITPLMERLDAEEVRDFLISVLFVIHRLPRRILIDIWLESDGSRALSILNLLEIVASVFSYRGRDHAISVTTRKQKSADKTLRQQPPSSSRLNSISDLNQTNYTDSGKDDDSSIPFAVLQLLNLSQEVAMIILDALQTFSKFFVQKHSKALSNGEHNEIFAKLLSLHLEFLKDNWPESIRLHALAAIAMFVNHYRLFLFDSGPLDALSVMIEHVLLQMASRLSSIQSAAAGLLQLILRSGYEALETQLANHAMAVSVLPANSVPDAHEISRSERLGRPGAQTGVALARLLGTKLTIFPSHRFEKGLQALESLVATDAKKGTQFDKAVMELIKQLRGVMLATVSLKDAEKDSIRLAELHVQLADSYRGSAALRSAWFDALANVHTNEKWYSEAAVCHAHTVAIYAKELAERGEISLDWDIFDWISREIAGQEKHLGKERTVQPGGFTLNNLSQKIEQTAQALTSAERYEAIGPLYRLIIPALEKKRDFNSLVSIYHELQQANSRAGEIKLSGKRHLGAYFRVRFIGQAFEKDNDTEWIYKEPGLTSLAEASLRMKENCLSKNINDVQILSETEVSYMNGNVSERAYMLITHVEPQVEGENRPKDFWTHTNLTTFTYETPIVEENATGDSSIVGQALKHVVLRVFGQFPSSLKRMRVIDSEQKIYSPLHFACQKLRMKAADIRSALPDVTEGRPLDIKRLQLMLQGAVAATVNAGPLAYAEAFTDSVQKKRYGEEGMNQLKDAFRELISACDVALATNKQAVGADQQSYHEMMATSFEGMQQRLQTFFNESFTNKNDEEKKYYPRTPNHVLDSIGGVN